MPTSSVFFGRLLGVALLSAIWAAMGCRVFRSQQVSDENISEARRLSLQGLDAQQRGQWDRAESLFAAAILKCPSDERARYGYAESLWQRGAWQQALSHMEEAARLSGSDPERLVRLGQMYLARGDLSRAEGQAELAIAANSQLFSAWALRGQVLQAKGDRSAALTSYHRALSFGSPLPEIQLAIAEIYTQENRPQRALATLQSLSGSFPPLQVPRDIVVREGLALRELGRHQDAARTLARAARYSDPPLALLHELARTQLLAGEIEAARHSVASVLASDPRHIGCLALAEELGMRTGPVTTASAAVAPR
jgi:tetratricopeptide (TPR) repeat protein